MHIDKLQTPDVVCEECVVVIDVLRAFTTASFAFSSGANRIIPVSTAKDAFALRNRFHKCLLMGAQNGEHIPGFDLGNSAHEIQQLNLKGYTLIQRTTAGTQGIVRSLSSKKILISSFTVAEATLKRILQLNPSKVSFVITGSKNGDEDFALAEYLESKIRKKGKVDPSPFFQKVISSPKGRFFSSFIDPRFPPSELHSALAIDIFPFAMEIFKEKEFSAIYPVNEFGTVLV